MKSPSQSLVPYTAIRESLPPELTTGLGRACCFGIWRSLTAKSNRMSGIHVLINRYLNPHQFEGDGNRALLCTIVGAATPQSTLRSSSTIVRTLPVQSLVPYANGVPPSSPGLRGTRYPGKPSHPTIQPQRGCVLPVSSRALENERTETLTALDGFLTGLGYLK